MIDITTIQARPFEVGTTPTNLELPLENCDVYEVQADTKEYYFTKHEVGIDVHVALYEVSGELITDTWWAPDCGDTILWRPIEEQVDWLLKGRM